MSNAPCVDAAARDALQRAASEQRVPLLEDCLATLDREARPVGDGGAPLLHRGTRRAVQSPDLDRRRFRRVRDLASRHAARARRRGDARSSRAGCGIWCVATAGAATSSSMRSVRSASTGRCATCSCSWRRRCRKYGASLVVATQNAQDLLGSDEGSVIATNCAVVLLGGHRAAETPEWSRRSASPSVQRRFLETASRGEFLLLAGDRRVAMRIEVPELHRAILTGATELPKPLDSSSPRLVKIWGLPVGGTPRCGIIESISLAEIGASCPPGRSLAHVSAQ